jgi:DNA-binding response OmpR family regulator
VERRCCLVVEDQLLVGLALEAFLHEAGFDVAGPFRKSSDALRWLEDRTPDLAVIDVLLRDGPCLPVARELRRKGIPYAVYSGLKPPRPIATEFEDVPWLEKPVSRHQLCATLRKLAPEASPTSSVTPVNTAKQD